MGKPLLPAEHDDYEQSVASILSVLGQETFAAAWASGMAAPLEEVIVSALGRDSRD
jgi:hypothetical protein